MSSEQLQALAAILLLNAVAWGGFMWLQEDPELSSGSATVTVTLDFGNAGTNATTFANATVVTLENITVTGDTTAYAAMLVAQRENGFVIEVTWYSLGPFIDTIDGVAGDSGHYWALYHNGEYASLGAGDLQLQDGDVVLWKFE